MSDKPRYAEFEDEQTAVAPHVDQHPAHTDPFVPQSGEPSVIPSAELSSEATMVVESGPDLSSEATMVHDSLANPLAPPAKLVVLEGVQKDKEYLLIGGTSISFGREKTNDISHPDLSVSRHHFDLHNNTGKFVLEDKGSSSGTLVNNKKVSGSINLKHNDKIQVGKTLLQFQMTDPKFQSAGGGGKQALIIALVVALLGLGGMAAVFTFVPMGGDDKDAGSVDARPVPTTPKADLYIKKGIELKSQLSWRAAKLMLQQATQLSPESFAARQLLKEVNAEEKTDFLLRKAEAKKLQGLLKEAYAAVKQAADLLAPGSISADKTWKLAIELIPAPEPPKVRKRRRRRRRWRRRRRRRRRKKVTKQKETRGAAWYFKHGDWNKAALKYSAKGDDQKAASVRSFFKKFDKARKAYRKWDLSTALEPLLSSQRLDMQLSGSDSVYTKQIKAMLANTLCAQGIESAKAKTPQGYITAFKKYQKATIYQPTHPESTKQLKKLEVVAKIWFKEAKAEKDKDKSKAKLKQILRITSRSEKINRKARLLLED